ncbi:hypothetical protein NGRA_0898, partial [Nosema granulosis]
MLIFLIIELVSAAVVCNCREYREECKPYCKDYYVYKNKMERERMIGDVEMVNKAPFINYVKDKIRATDVGNQLMPGIVNQPPVLMNPLGLVGTITRSLVPAPYNYEINGDLLRYQNRDYNICEALKESTKQEYNEELKRILERINKENIISKRCEMLRLAQLEVTLTSTVEKTKTVEKTSTIERTVERTSTVSPIDSTSTLPQIIIRPQIYIPATENQNSNIYLPNPNTEHKINNPMEELCKKYQKDETPPTICIQNANLQTEPANIQTIATPVNIQTVERPISTITTTEFKTTIIPTTSTMILSIKTTTTSISTSIQIKTNYIHEEKITPPKTTRTRFITNIKTATKTLINPVRKPLKPSITTSLIQERMVEEKSAEKEEKMVDMLLYLRKLLRELKKIAESGNKNIPPGSPNNSSDSISSRYPISSRVPNNTITTTSPTTSTTNLSSTIIALQRDDQAKFSIILKELSAIKEMNRSLEKKLIENSTKKRFSKTSSKVAKTKEMETIEPDLFTKKVLEVMKMKELTKEKKTLTKTKYRTITISKKKKKNQSSTLTMFMDDSELGNLKEKIKTVYKKEDTVATKKDSVKKRYSKKKKEDSVENKKEPLDITRTTTLVITDIPKNTVVNTTTITLNNTVISTLPPSTQSITQSVTSIVTKPETITITKPETSTITKPETITVTNSITSTVTDSVTNTVTKPETITVTKPEISKVTDLITSTIINPVTSTVAKPKTIAQSIPSSQAKNGFFRRKFYNVFRKQSSSSSLEIFHSLVSENLVSLASVISEIKDKKANKTDTTVEKTVSIRNDIEHMKIEKEIAEIKSNFNEILKELKRDFPVASSTTIDSNTVSSVEKKKESCSSPIDVASSSPIDVASSSSIDVASSSSIDVASSSPIDVASSSPIDVASSVSIAPLSSSSIDMASCSSSILAPSSSSTEVPSSVSVIPSSTSIISSFTSIIPSSTSII